ncbi:MAG: Fic family protein [Rickettsiales bacterium]|jgi:Fic family protein|nr:Fic family protein [Rickettsiales bacterium]
MKYKGQTMDKIIQTITAKKAKLDKLLSNKNNRHTLNNWLKTELAYTSNAIEGNTLSRRETELAIAEEITGGSKPLKDYIEAKNHSVAFDFALDAIFSGAPIDENLILAIHKKILTGIDDDNAGHYRNVHVRISGSRVILPNHLKVPELMCEFNKWLKTKTDNAVQKSITAHFRLVSIHPFIDGNGRTSRLLMNMMLLNAGYAPIIIRKIDRRRYLMALEKYQLTQDNTQYEKFMLGALSRSLSMVIDLLDKAAVNPQKMLTIAKFADLAGLPTSTIRYWVKENKLKPAGYSQSGYILFDKSQVRELKKLKLIP